MPCLTNPVDKSTHSLLRPEWCRTRLVLADQSDKIGFHDNEFVSCFQGGVQFLLI
jgi:hypothetical protein